MSPWLPQAIMLAANVALIAIRAPHGRVARRTAVRESRRGARETALLAFAWAGYALPLAWLATPWLSSADYPAHPAALAAGSALLAAGLALLHRSHADLGRHWSLTLELREEHELVTGGVYRRIRHPMYAALFLYSLGQLLALPNWVAGPSYLVPLTLLFVLRVGPEERMMRDTFGELYLQYAARTKRLVPGLW